LNVFHCCGNINQYETRKEREEREGEERREKGEFMSAGKRERMRKMRE
jgi:hypothetical protein